MAVPSHNYAAAWWNVRASMQKDEACAVPAAPRTHHGLAHEVGIFLDGVACLLDELVLFVGKHRGKPSWWHDTTLVLLLGVPYSAASTGSISNACWITKGFMYPVSSRSGTSALQVVVCRLLLLLFATTAPAYRVESRMQLRRLRQKHPRHPHSQRKAIERLPTQFKRWLPPLSPSRLPPVTASRVIHEHRRNHHRQPDDAQA